MPRPNDFLELLSGTFPKPQSVVKSMAANSVLLCGHHALKVFFDRVDSSDQPFLFLVPDSEECMSAFLATLEDTGAQFQDIFEIFRRLLAASEDEAETVDMMYHDMVYYVKAKNRLADEPDYKCGPEIATFLAHAAKMFEIRRWDEPEEDRILSADEKAPILLDLGNSFVVVHLEEPDEGGRFWRLPNTAPEGGPITFDGHVTYKDKITTISNEGHIVYEDKVTKISIITRKGYSPIELLMEFSFSHMQCFLSAYGAAHMYYDRTANNETYAWNAGTTTLKAHQGFKLRSKPYNNDLVVARGLNNQQFPGARLVIFEFDFDLGVAVERVKAREEALSSLTWLQDGRHPWQVVNKALHVRLVRDVNRGVATEATLHRCICAYVVGCIFGEMPELRDSILLF